MADSVDLDERSSTRAVSSEILAPGPPAERLPAVRRLNPRNPRVPIGHAEAKSLGAQGAKSRPERTCYSPSPVAGINFNLSDTLARGEGAGLTYVHWARAVLYNGLGWYEEALAEARQAAEDSPLPSFTYWAMAELVEAASRTSNDELAAVG